MGLLDGLNDPMAMGLLGAGAALLQPRRVGFGDAINAFQGSAVETQNRVALQKRNEQQTQLLMMQLAQMKEAQEREKQRRMMAQQFNQTPGAQAASLPGGPTEANAAQIPNMPGGFDAKGYMRALLGTGDMEGAAQASGFIPKAPAPYTMKPGEVRFGGDDKPIASVPGEEKLDALIVRGPDGKPMINPLALQAKSAIAKAGASSVSVNTGQKGLDNELKIRGDFRSEPVYKAFQETDSAFRQIKSGLAQKSPAGDLAAATKFMKLLDPGSVVRESELVMAMQASGALDRLLNYSDRLLKGTKLTPDQREDFGKLAEQFYSDAQKQYNAKRGEYEGFANDYGLNSNRILGRPSGNSGFTYLGTE
jgi:hypothetical protein